MHILGQKEVIWNTIFSIFERRRGPQTSRGPGKLPPSPSRRACSSGVGTKSTLRGTRRGPKLEARRLSRVPRVLGEEAYHRFSPPARGFAGVLQLPRQEFWCIFGFGLFRRAVLQFCYMQNCVYYYRCTIYMYMAHIIRLRKHSAWSESWGCLSPIVGHFEGAKVPNFDEKPPVFFFQNKVGCPPYPYKKFKRKPCSQF